MNDQVYRGPDRRRGARAPRHYPTLGAVAATVVGALLMAAAVELVARATGLGVGLRPMSDALEVLATALFAGAAALRYASWRVTGAASQASGSAALVVFAAATFPVTLGVRTLVDASGPTVFGGLARLAACLTVAVILAPALAGGAVDSRLRPWRLVLGGMLGAAGVYAGAAATVRWSGSALLASADVRSALDLSASAVWIGVTALWLRAAARRRDPAAVWSAVATGLVVVSGVVRAATADRGAWPWLVAVGVLMLAAAAVSAANAVAEAQFVLMTEDRRFLATSGALADAEQLLLAVETRREELVHDARSLITTLRTASVTLDRHGDDLDRATVSRLHAAMDSELGRLGRLLDGVAEGSVEDLVVGDVVESVIATLTTQGVPVRADLAGLRVRGRADDLAEAVRQLLVNVWVHAPGSDVAVHGRVEPPWVRIVVDDHGPGIPVAARTAVLERGVALGRGGGSGLGLHVARRLVLAQGGDLHVEERPGGGTRVVVSLPWVGGTARGNRGDAVVDLRDPVRPVLA